MSDVLSLHSFLILRARTIASCLLETISDISFNEYTSLLSSTILASGNKARQDDFERVTATYSKFISSSILALAWMIAKYGTTAVLKKAKVAEYDIHPQRVAFLLKFLKKNDNSRFAYYDSEKYIFEFSDINGYVLYDTSKETYITVPKKEITVNSNTWNPIYAEQIFYIAEINKIDGTPRNS